MRVRYRNLSSRMDVDAIAKDAKRRMEEEYEDRRRNTFDDDPVHGPSELVRVAASVEGAVSMPRIVDVKEGEAELQMVREWVRDGTLDRRDLVDVGRGWETIEHCLEFDDIVHGALPEGGAASSGNWIGMAIIAILVAGLAMLIIS